jgi:hypothetical protein
VWLLDDGSCESGHGAEFVSGANECPTSLPAVPVRARGNRKSGLAFAIVGATLVLLVVFGLVVAIPRVFSPLLGKGTALAGEWKARLAADYPGWRVAGFKVDSFSDSSSPQTNYTFALVPPGRSLAVGVRYKSIGGGPYLLEDETLRPKGKYSARADSLLDFLERNYLKKGTSIVSVRAWPIEEGLLQVQWRKTAAVGPVSTSRGSVDILRYDERTRTWGVAGTTQ